MQKIWTAVQQVGPNHPPGCAFNQAAFEADANALAAQQADSKKRGRKKGVKAEQADAAVLLQRNWRMHAAKHEVQGMRQQAAATTLARIYRGRQARAHLDETHPGMRDKLKNSQAHYRALRSRRLERDFGASPGTQTQDTTLFVLYELVS